MKEYKYKYELSEDEIVEYYRYIINRLPKNQRLLVWIRFCIPLLAIFTIIFFKLWPNIIADGVAIIVIFFWITIGSELVWRQLMNLRVDKSFLGSLNVKEFKVLNVSFKEKININGKSIQYNQIANINPLKKSIVFFLESNEVFIIPLRVIGDDENIKELYRDILLHQKERTQ